LPRWNAGVTTTMARPDAIAFSANSVQRIELRWPSSPKGRRGTPGESPLLRHFYAGPENRLAAFVCGSGEAIAQRGNPLLLVGPSGSGKSALAATLAAGEVERQGRGRLVRLTAVDFARRYAEAV